MTELMRQEMQELCYLFFGGMATMLLFSVRDILLERLQNYPQLGNCIYIGFWVLAAVLFYQFAYGGAYGVLSWYSLIAFACGIMLWKRTFYDIITLYRNVQKQNGDINNEKEKKGPHSEI